MRPMLTLALASATLALVAAPPQPNAGARRPAAQPRAVDVFLGTGAHGHTYPGATRPFGMVQLSPANGQAGWDWSSGYHWSSKVISGFVHTALDGTGIGDLCDLLVAPRVGRLPDDAFAGKKIQDSALAFTHDQEVARPGYYAVTFKDAGLRAEVTATERVGFHRYTFPKDQPATLVLDLGFAINWDKPMDTAVQGDGKRFTGRRHSKGWAADQKLFFVMDLSQAASEVRYMKAGKVVPASEAHGPDVKLLLTFDRHEGRPIQVKMALSTVDEAGASANLKAELSGWDFQATTRASEALWAKTLAPIQATHLSKEEAQVFDTALYRSFLTPNLYSDRDGRYRGADGKIHQAKGFDYTSTYSLWDTYRAMHPLFTLAAPEKVDGFVKTMLAFHAQTGQLPSWKLWNNEAHCMIGYHAVPVLVEAVMKGLTTADPKAILKACVDAADRDYQGLASYRKLGFVDSATEKEACAKTLEYAFDDSGIARLAEKVGDTATAERFRKRALSYQNVFDAKTGFMRGRKADGTWDEPFNPKAVSHRNDAYCEGNAWQWTWSVQHDPAGLVKLFGGRDAFASKLDALFNQSSQLEGEEVSPDISGMVGQLAQGNEPSHHTPYLYAWAGQPWKTQMRVRQLMDTFYKPGPEGLCGNNDCGQMSAWYVFNALGFYPVDPASGVYVLGSPRVVNASMQLPGGKKLVVKALNQSKANVYVQSVAWRGKVLDRTWIRHEELKQGGELVFTMGAKPNEAWGSATQAAPPSGTDLR